MFLKPLRVLFGLPGALLGASWSLLGRLGTKLGWSWGYFWGTLIFYYFLERLWEQNGCPKGGILGAQTDQTSIQNRDANLRPNNSSLGVLLGRFGLDSQAVLGSKYCFLIGV